MTWVAGVFLGLAVLITASQVAARMRGRRTGGTAPPVVPGPFGEALEACADLLAVFTSPNCSACRTQAPVIEALGRDFPAILTVDITSDLHAARAFRITATPTTVIIRKGVIRAFLVGVQMERTLRALLSASPSA